MHVTLAVRLICYSTVRRWQSLQIDKAALDQNAEVLQKLRREIYGTRSERKARLLEQMELQLEDLEAAATEDELAAENAAARTQTVQSFQRKRPSRKPFPIIWRTSVSSSPHQKAVPVAGRRSCRSWARILPRRWR